MRGPFILSHTKCIQCCSRVANNFWINEKRGKLTQAPAVSHDDRYDLIPSRKSPLKANTFLSVRTAKNVSRWTITFRFWFFSNFNRHETICIVCVMQRTSDIMSSQLGIILQVIYPPETVTYLRATLKLPRAECSKTVYSNLGELTVDILLLNNAKRVVENNNNKKNKILGAYAFAYRENVENTTCNTIPW